MSSKYSKDDKESAIHAEILRANARMLAGTLKTQEEFGERINAEPSRVSQLIGKNPSKNIGASTARRIELAFHLPRGWMDVPHGAEEIAYLMTVDHRELIDLFDCLTDAQRVQFLHDLRAFKALNIRRLTELKSIEDKLQ